MNFYCKVENGAIIDGPRKAPTTFKNISNFHLLTDSEKADNGFYLVIRDILTMTQKHGEPIIDSEAKTVTYPVLEMTPEEIAESQQDPV